MDGIAQRNATYIVVHGLLEPTHSIHANALFPQIVADLLTVSQGLVDAIKVTIDAAVAFHSWVIGKDTVAYFVGIASYLVTSTASFVIYDGEAVQVNSSCLRTLIKFQQTTLAHCCVVFHHRDGVILAVPIVITELAIVEDETIGGTLPSDNVISKD